MLALVLAENQEAVAAGMHERDAARNLGWAHRLTPAQISAAVRELAADAETRARLSASARALVDGRGAERAVAVLRGEFILRDATAADAKLLFDWANDAHVRAVSFDSAPIVWENHVRWLNARLSNPEAFTFIAESVAGAPIGLARFDFADGEAIISISIDAGFRGRGFGAKLIAQAARWARRRKPIGRIRALIKPDNEASLRSFAAAGFVEAASAAPNGTRTFFLE